MKVDRKLSDRLGSFKRFVKAVLLSLAGLKKARPHPRN